MYCMIIWTSKKRKHAPFKLTMITYIESTLAKFKYTIRYLIMF